jgi:monoamine oxidase
MPHGRTPLFRKLLQSVQQAHWLNQHPDKREFFFETRAASRLSRREFVRILGAAGVVTAAGGLAPRAARGKETRPSAVRNREPVAIIGAGVAGLTAAYRLHQAGIPCEIFEGSERTGGRILTKYDFNKDAMFCELGGELVDSNHQDLITLATELGVDIQELKSGDQGADLYFFDGKHYSDEQLIPLFQPFARKLAADLEGIYDKEENFTAKAQGFDKISLDQYLAESSKGVEKWVIDLLRVAYTIEYGRDADEQSALNLIVYLKPDTSTGFKIFGDSDESKRIKGGSSSLPNALAKALAGKVKIQQGHNLLKIAEANSNLVLTFGTNGSSKEVKFTRVICAIPFTMLRLVDGVKALALSKRKQETITQLGYGNNSKVMYGFTERWWRNPAVKLPALSNGSVYTDLTLQCTWESSRGQTGESGILTNFLGGAAAVKRLTDTSFEKFREELLLVFPGIGDKFDGKRALMSWPDYKFTRGSYSCPLVGQYTTLLQTAPTPELGGCLLFAGEHTSGDFAGFMNGAVQSGNRAAKEIIAPGKVKLRKAA